MRICSKHSDRSLVEQCFLLHIRHRPLHWYFSKCRATSDLGKAPATPRRRRWWRRLPYLTVCPTLPSPGCLWGVLWEDAASSLGQLLLPAGEDPSWGRIGSTQSFSQHLAAGMSAWNGATHVMRCWSLLSFFSWQHIWLGLYSKTWTHAQDKTLKWLRATSCADC